MIFQRKYKYLMMVLLLLLAFSVTLAQGQTKTITGTVVDNVAGEPLPGANVYIKGKMVGAAANMNGEFTIKTKSQAPFTVVASMIGYETTELEYTGEQQTLAFSLTEATIMASEITVAASRVEESILQAPVSIEKIDLLEIKRSPSVSLYDGLANMKEVTLTANSLLFTSATGRGFGGLINRGMIQLIDGIDNSPIASGQFALGNMTGLSDIDVAEVEFLPGASSALYGPNAFSGVLFMNSKSPFDYQGLTAQVKSGAMSSEYGGSNSFREVALRYAKAYGNFAFKIVGTDLRATEWSAHNFSDRNPAGTPASGFNGVNVYGDEVASTFDLDALAGTPSGTFGSVFVARTGYKEEDLFDGDATNTKINTSLRYRPTEDVELSYDFRYGTGHAIYQGANRYALNGLWQHFNKLEAKGKNFFIRGYMAQEGAGDAYDLVFSGWNINRRWKSDQQWFGEYLPTYIGALAQGADAVAADIAARTVADDGRFLPGSADFNDALKDVISTKSFATGAGFTTKSRYYNGEAMYNFSDMTDVIDVQIGANYRTYDVNTEGTIYSDATGSIDVSEFGAYAQATKRLFDDKFKLTGSLRFDGHKNFEDRLSPRVAAVFSPVAEHNFRASYQSGFNNPVIESQYINLNLGPIVLLGASQDNMDRTGLQRVYDSSLLLDENNKPVGITKVPFRVPEFQTSFEIGYKGMLANSFFVDLSFYQSDYEDRFKSVRVVDPTTGQLYQIYTNELDETVTLRGVGADLQYRFDSGFEVGGSYSFIEQSGGTLDILTNLNRPKHTVKISVGHPKLTRDLGFNIAARYHDAYEFRSTFGIGDVKEALIIDAQISYKLPGYRTTLKAGVNNATRNDHIQAYGSVDVGTTFYMALTYDSIFGAL